MSSPYGKGSQNLCITRACAEFFSDSCFLWLHTPSSSESLVECDQSKILGEYGPVEGDAGIEIAALGIKYVEIVQRASTILHTCELYIFCGSIPEVCLPGTCLTAVSKRVDGRRDF